MSDWRKSGEFQTRENSGGQLICQADYENFQSHAVIKQIMPRGYNDGSYYLYLTPINTLTAAILKNKFKEKMSALQIDMQKSKQVAVKIDTIDELKMCLSSISEIDSIDSGLSDELQNDFLWFRQKQPTPDKKLNKQNDSDNFTHAEYPLNEHEIKLSEAVRLRNINEIDRLLRYGVNPNLPLHYGKTLLLEAIWEYIEEKNESIRKEWYAIIKKLLDYRADYSKRHLYFHETALSAAADHGCDELVNLMLRYSKQVEFKISDESEGKENNQTVTNLRRHFKRIAFFEEQALKNAAIPTTDIKLKKPENNSNAVVETAFNQGKHSINVETYITTSLSASDFDCIFNLYKSNFNSQNEDTEELQREHLKEKFGLNNPNKRIYCDVVKANGKIVGFNLFEIYSGVYENRPYQIVYCSLAYVDKEYRGTRAMSLLSFRAPMALKLISPSTETYIFYDAIHPNSFRQAYDMEDLFPFYRTEESPDFVKHGTKQIYGEERAATFDFKTKLYLPTNSRVQGNPIRVDEYDLPCVIDRFDEITEGKEGVPGQGGVPMMFPVTDENFKRLSASIDSKLNCNTKFESHVRQYGELVFGCKPADKMGNSVTCLLPGYLGRRDK